LLVIMSNSSVSIKSVAIHIALFTFSALFGIFTQMLSTRLSEKYLNDRKAIQVSFVLMGLAFAVLGFTQTFGETGNTVGLTLIPFLLFILLFSVGTSLGYPAIMAITANEHRGTFPATHFGVMYLFSHAMMLLVNIPLGQWLSQLMALKSLQPFWLMNFLVSIVLAAVIHIVIVNEKAKAKS
ncbi:hypothetical protein CS022_24335, partial [Veronia nyctiphanis]